MYLQHFGLKRFPFDITSDPDFLWSGENHRQALSVLQEGVFENRGFVVLTGEIGTGKTTLINAFRRLDDIATIIVTIPDPDMEVLDFFHFLAHEFEVEGSFQTPEEFVQTFKSFLLRAYASYRKVLIIIDEAQRLNNLLLAEISKLAKIEMAGRRLLKIFLVGQLEFNQILMAEENKAILEEVVAAHSLGPLSKAEIQEYISHRMAVAGCDRDVFATAALARIHAYTGGLPRSINVLCDHALLKGFLKKAISISPELIENCANNIRLPSAKIESKPATIPISNKPELPDYTVRSERKLVWKRVLIRGLSVLFLIFIIGLVYNYEIVLSFLFRVLEVVMNLLSFFAAK